MEDYLGCHILAYEGHCVCVSKGWSCVHCWSLLSGYMQLRHMAGGLGVKIGHVVWGQLVKQVHTVIVHGKALQVLHLTLEEALLTPKKTYT